MQTTLDRMSRPSKPPTENVRMERDVARKARMIAAALGMSLPDYLTERMRPVVDAELPAVMKIVENRKARRPPKPD